MGSTLYAGQAWHGRSASALCITEHRLLVMREFWMCAQLSLISIPLPIIFLPGIVHYCTQLRSKAFCQMAGILSRIRHWWCLSWGRLLELRSKRKTELPADAGGKRRAVWKRTRQTPPRSKLLSLPPEIRLLIWEYTVGGNFIAIYFLDGYLAHGLLDETNTLLPGKDVPLRYDTMMDMLSHLPGDPYENDIRPRPRRHNFLSLFRTCRLM